MLNIKLSRKSILNVSRYRDPNPRFYDRKASAHPTWPTGLSFQRFLFANKLNVIVYYYYKLNSNKFERKQEGN